MRFRVITNGLEYRVQELIEVAKDESPLAELLRRLAGRPRPRSPEWAMCCTPFREPEKFRAFADALAFIDERIKARIKLERLADWRPVAELDVDKKGGSSCESAS